MAASYPTSIKSFTTKVDGEVFYASHISDLELEVVAIETALKTGPTALASASLSSATASEAVFTNSTKDLVSNSITGSGNVVMSASPTLTGTITAAAATFSVPLIVASGGTGLATLTNKSVLVGAATGTVAGVAPGSSGNVLTSDGTDWASSAAAGGATKKYTATLTDVINTDAQTQSLAFTVPANDWAEGEVIAVNFSALDKNNKGSAGRFKAHFQAGAGAAVLLCAAAGTLWQNDTPEFDRPYLMHLYRIGGSVHVASGVDATSNSVNPFMTFHASFNFGSVTTQEFKGVSTPTNFTSDFVVQVLITLDAADLTFYHKPQTASVIKFEGNA